MSSSANLREFIEMVIELNRAPSEKTFQLDGKLTAAACFFTSTWRLVEDQYEKPQTRTSYY